MTTDIFDNKILCKDCDTEMKSISMTKNGFLLRFIVCDKCGNRIMHPKDEKEYKDFMNIRKKEFNVKMRFVGNSYSISIPKEIVNFIKEHEKIVDDMVRLCFEEFNRLSLEFGCNGNHNGTQNGVNENKIKKVKIQ